MQIEDSLGPFIQTLNERSFWIEVSNMKELTNRELSSLAYKKVKEMILSNQLRPGEKIVQDKLATTLGISRTPLRTALQMLESEYLVESIPRRGVVVRKLSNEKMVEIYDCRIALESTAVRRFTQIATKDKIERVKRFFSDFIKQSNIDVEKYQIEDIKFHDYIITNCGNSFLGKLFQQSNLLLCINQIGLVRPAHETLPEHLKIINAIDDGDCNLAVELTKDHLLKSKDLITRKL